jgi:5S rRNA maturation endonuclease (ribonuclease M5)
LDIEEYLIDKGCTIKPANDNNISTHCFFCGEDEHKRGRLYINVDPTVEPVGLYFCFLCGSKGTFNTILKHFGDAPIFSTSREQFEDSDISDDTYCEIFAVAAEFYHAALFENEKAYSYLTRDRGLTEDTIKHFRLGWTEGGLLTELVKRGFTLQEAQESGLVDRFGQDTFVGRIVIPYMVSGVVVDLRAKDMNGKYKSLPKHKARLFNQDALLEPPEPSEEPVSHPAHPVKNQKDTQQIEVSGVVPPPPPRQIDRNFVVITEGEFDAMTLWQLGICAVGVPGAMNWNDAWTGYLTERRRIYICFDNDTTGNASAEKLAQKLGAKSRIVEMPKAKAGKDKIDVNSWVADHGKTAEDFHFLFSKAKGGLLVSVYEAYQRWNEIEGNPELAGLRFNIESLDAQMRHGLLPAQVITMIAKTNSGKTLTMINMFHRMSMLKPDIKILFVSLEQTRNEWFERAHRIMTFYHPDATIADTIDYWNDKMLLVDKNRITQEQLSSCVEQYQFETGAKLDLLGLDYIGYYARSFKGEEYARVTNAIHSLKELAKNEEIVVLAPSQVNRTGQFGKTLSADQAKSSGGIEETSDMLLAIVNSDQRPDIRREDMTREIDLHVLKSRDGGIGHVAKMQFCPLTLAMVPMNDPLFPRALKEKEYSIAGDSYEQVVYRHRTGDQAIFLGNKV